MNRLIGFSTGSLSGSDFRAALVAMDNTDAKAIELSALRESELAPLLDSVSALSLGKYEYVSVHAPSALRRYEERDVVRMLRKAIPGDFSIVVHADIIRNTDAWKQLGSQLCIENMDKRKPTGRTVREMRPLLDSLPKARLCLDLAHARQVDPSLSESVDFLLAFSGRLAQIHLSELNSASKHEPLSFSGVMATQAIRDLVPRSVPVILEYYAQPHELQSHLVFAKRVLDLPLPKLNREVG